MGPVERVDAAGVVHAEGERVNDVAHLVMVSIAMVSIAMLSIAIVRRASV